MNALEKIEKARSRLVIKHPFFGLPSMRLSLVENHSIPTACTDGKTLMFNPAYVDELDDSKVVFLVAHEATHVSCLHHTRLRNFPHDIANRGADYVINVTLVDAEVGEMPEGGLIDEKYRGWSAEAVCRQLMKEEEESEQEEGDEPSDEEAEGQEEGETTEGEQDSGQDEGESDEDGDETSSGGAGDEEEEGDADAQGDAENGGDESEGGGAGDPSGSDFGGCGEFVTPDLDEVEIQNEENEVRGALQQAANFEKAMSEAGVLPGELERILEATVDPRASWRVLLARYMQSFANADYSWTSPNRRYVGSGTYVPSMRETAMGPMAFVIDASGSMPTDALNEAVSELNGLLEELNPEFVDVIVHDHGVRGEPIRFETDEPIEIKVRAGGGTAFAPVLPFLEDEPYQCVVWFTDTYTFDWDACYEPGPPVIFLDWANNSRVDNTFGEEVIPMEDI